MTTKESTSQLQLSTDLEILHARVKGKSLTLAELKQSLKGRGSAMLLILLALPFCFISVYLRVQNNPHRFYKLDHHEIR